MSNRHTTHPMVVTIRPVIADLTLILSALIAMVPSSVLMLTAPPWFSLQAITGRTSTTNMWTIELSLRQRPFPSTCFYCV